MNWGHKITIVIISFIVIMLSMVYISFKQTNEMEDSNYYDKELKYQSKIDAANNLSEASSDTLLTQNESGIIIRIPTNLRTGFEKGKIEFLRSDDKSKDMTINFQPDSSGIFIVDHSKFSYGFYKARIEWNNDNKHYYREQTILVRK